MIVGGESGPKARPFDIAWARSTVKECGHWGVPVFVKQLGARPIWNAHPIPPKLGQGGRGKGGDQEEWPEDLRVRQFPEARP